jgi:type I restriction enzyme S subunit
MSKIDHLLLELCPEGVPVSAIDELFQYEQPTKYLVDSTDYSKDGTAVLTAGKTFVLGYTKEEAGIYPASQSAPVLIFDDFTTSFKWVDFPFKAKSSAMKMITAKSGSPGELRFLWHWMGARNFKPGEHTRHWISVYSKFEIPSPPLEVQREIVSILDKFTQLEAELEAEIEAELEARRIQYEATRDRLIGSSGALESHSIESRTPTEFLETRPLVRLADLVKTLIPVGKIPRSKFQREGLFPVVDQSQAIISGYTDDESLVNDFGPCVVFGDHTREIKYVDFRFAAGADGTVVLLPIGDLSARFLFYSLQSLRIQSRGYNRHWSVVKELQITIPSQQRQAEIVAILDKLDALVNDISIGLPAEVATRRMQYEYHRNKLLTFKELESA